MKRLPVAVFLVVSALVPSACNRHSSGHGGDDGLGKTTASGALAPTLKNLGKYERKVETKSAAAQRYFNQGLVLVYGFNHAEALRSFREAARLDRDCAMAYWGQALALAPNINDPAIGPDRERQGYEAIVQSRARISKASDVERALIKALTERFSSETTPDRAALNSAYAEAMKKTYAEFPRDPDVAVLYADAVMNTMPWDYWLKNGQPRAGVAEAVAAVEAAMKLSPSHPGAHHIYIHAVEASPDPDRAVPSADLLGSLVPAAGHLVHMPSHIYIRVGRYADAVSANQRAVAADEDYITQCRAQGIYPAAYYPHNVHFLFAALAMDGRSHEAIVAARKVAARHDHQDLYQPGFGFPHLLKATPLLALVRFGKWDEVLAEPDPGNQMRFGQAVRHYARGLAFLRKSNLAGARAELEALRLAAAHPSLPALKIMEMNDLASIASIAVHLLDAELQAAQGRPAEAVAAARRAVDAEDNLRYSEPPDWPIPPRHTLGALLLESKQPRLAEITYRDDLSRHRNNGWSLRGLELSLRAQGRTRDAEQAAGRFARSWAHADIAIASSRF